MPIRPDVHRTGRAAVAADQMPPDPRPRPILRQAVESHVSLVPAVAVAAHDVAGDVALCDPFRRAARQEIARPFRVLAPRHGAIKAALNQAGKLSMPRGSMRRQPTGHRGCGQNRLDALRLQAGSSNVR